MEGSGGAPHKRFRVGALSWKEVAVEVEIQTPVRQLLEGLSALHGAGITHRDLKPLVSKMTTCHEEEICDRVSRLTCATESLIRIYCFTKTTASRSQISAFPNRPVIVSKLPCLHEQAQVDTRRPRFSKLIAHSLAAIPRRRTSGRLGLSL